MFKPLLLLSTLFYSSWALLFIIIHFAYLSLRRFLERMSSFLLGVLKYIGSSILWGWFTRSGRSDSFCKFLRRKPFKFSSANVFELRIPAGAGFALAPPPLSVDVLMYCLATAADLLVMLFQGLGYRASLLRWIVMVDVHYSKNKIFIYLFIL